MDFLNLLNSIPEWLGGAVIGAIVAALGFLGKRLYDAIEKTRTERKNAVEREKLRRGEAIAQLEQLQALLDESWSIFTSQNYQRNRLASLLQERYGDKVPLQLGYDEAFYQMYGQMKPEERELFQIIRGLTMHSMYRVNERLRQWTDNNKTAGQLVGELTPAIQQLDSQLLQLKAHLSHWFAKYNTVFAKDERRSLVYLGDEKAQGVEFPAGLESALDKALEELRR